MATIKKWYVRDNRVPGGYREIRGATLEEAVRDNTDWLMLVGARGTFCNPVKCLSFECHWNDGILGGKGGIEVTFHALANNVRPSAAPDYQEMEMDFVVWLKGDFDKDVSVSLTD